MIFKSDKSIAHKDLALSCETVQIKQANEDYIDWDDSITIRKFVTQAEFEWIERRKEE